MSDIIDLMSSPDPLNDLPIHQTSTPRRALSSRKPLSLQQVSPNKQSFELNVSDKLSPRKIRVTVEAGSDIENSPSPTRKQAKRRERTTTTKVPLKGLSDNEADVGKGATPKRGRGRPRKSVAGSTTKVGRPATPTRGKRPSIGGLVDEDAKDGDFEIGRNVSAGRGKGRSRSRSANDRIHKPTPADKAVASSEKNMSSAASRKGRVRRKTLLPDEAEALEVSGGAETQASETLPCLKKTGGAPSSPKSDTIQLDSRYSTIRTTTTLGSIRSDIVLARFDPGNETPQKLGWSSPHTVEAFQRPNAIAESEKVKMQPYQSSILRNGVDAQENRKALVPSESRDAGGGIVEHEGRNGGDEKDEHTQAEDASIFESEGFSMISVDSVPSMQAHRSSPLSLQPSPASYVAPSKDVVALQREGQQNDSFSSISSAVLEAATPGRNVVQSNSFITKDKRSEPGFSSITSKMDDNAPPIKSHVSRIGRSKKSRPRSSSPVISIGGRIAEAAVEPSEAQKSLTLRAPQIATDEDSFSAIPSVILEAASPIKTQHPAQTAPDIPTAYEDSFSAVPSAILDAASPIKLHKPSSDLLATQCVSEAGSEIQNRLPTPDKTPSPPREEVSQDVPVEATEPQLKDEQSSIMQSYIRSSPPNMAAPRYTYTAHLRRQSLLNPDTTQTPSIVFSSPTLPPLRQARQVEKTVQSQRKPLNPTLQAGRVLQDITGPSPARDRSQSLGSPFRSPNADRKLSSKGAQSHVEQNAASSDEHRNHGRSHSNATKGSTLEAQNDDPFSSSADTRSQAAITDGNYALGIPREATSTVRKSSIRDANMSFDAMSWQAETEIAIDQPDGDRNPGARRQADPVSHDTATSWEQRQAAERAAVSRQIQNANGSQVIIIESDVDRGDQDKGDEGAAEADEDDELGLLIETLNSSSPAVQRYDSTKFDTAEKPRRGKLPSPWRKNSKRLIYSDELAHNLPEPKNVQPDSTVQARPIPRIMSRLDRARGLPKGQQVDDDMDISTLSPAPIPQKANFKPRSRLGEVKDLSALLGPSPVKKVTKPVMDISARRMISNDTNNLNKPVTNTIEGGTALKDLGPIAQKQGFRPRLRDRDEPSTLFSSPTKEHAHFASGMAGALPDDDSEPQTPEVLSARSRRLSNTSETQANTSGLTSPAHEGSSLSDQAMGERREESDDENERTSIHGEDYFSAVAKEVDATQPGMEIEEDSEGSADEQHEESSPERESPSIRTRRWTETVNFRTPTNPFAAASPPKSILRSPVKALRTTCAVSPSKSVAWASSSSANTPISHSQSLLFSSEWCDTHWLFLQKILWRQRAALPPVTSWPPSPTTSVPPCSQNLHNTRTISSLLGRTTRSGRYTMDFEQWHLDVAAEFRAKVPGWEEKNIVGKVFALLVQEEIYAGRLPRRGEKGDGDGKVGVGGEWILHRCADGRTGVWRWIPDEKKGWLGWLRG